MSQHVLNILLILVQMFEIQASGQYFKLDKEITWNDARNECDMAIPKVMIDSDEFVMDVQDHIDIEENGLWVGYFTKKTAFEYIGCSEKPLSSVNVSSVHNAPGLCHTACKGAAYIGISRKECFCLDEINALGSTMLTGCDRSCRSNDYISCGGNNRQSIYRVSKEVSGKEANGDCLSFEYSDGVHKIFTWETCSGYQPPLCTNRSISGSHEPWSVSIQQCFSQKSRPSTYKDLQNTTHAVYPSWSGIIRSEVMYIAKEFDDTNRNVQYGYLTTDSNTQKQVLKFINFKDGKGKKFALCQNKQTSDDKSSTSTGVAVGVSVAVVLIVILVTSTVIVLKRRNKIPVLCIGMAKTKESAYTDSVNTTARKPNLKVAYDNHGYSVASKKSNIDDGNQADDNNEGYTYFVDEQPENETYNVIGPMTNANIKKENDYNEIASDINATYDRAYGKENNEKRNPNDTYDTTENAAKKLKDIAGNNPDEVGDTDEDDYSHINHTPLGGSKTDNVYGVPNHHENFSGDAEKSPVKDMLIGEDTYNHINNKPLKSNKTDNVYGVPGYSSETES